MILLKQMALAMMRARMYRLLCRCPALGQWIGTHVLSAIIDYNVVWCFRFKNIGEGKESAKGLVTHAAAAVKDVPVSHGFV